MLGKRRPPGVSRFCVNQNVWKTAAAESIFAPQLDIGWPSTSKTSLFDVQLEMLGNGGRLEFLDFLN
jgi:hypothetical protein